MELVATHDNFYKKKPSQHLESLFDFFEMWRWKELLVAPSITHYYPYNYNVSYGLFFNNLFGLLEFHQSRLSILKP
jgi:hypothetical protein